MTIKLKVVGIAKAQFTTVNLPAELEAGKIVTGSIVLTNIGTAAGKLRLEFITAWDGTIYRSISPVAVAINGTFSVPITSVLNILMPNKDAVINMTAEHETAVGSETWTTDALASH